MRNLFASCSDPGKLRQKNEDCAGHIRNNAIDGELFCVADGMGGHEFGELASRTVVDSLLSQFSALSDASQSHAEQLIAALFADAHEALYLRKQQDNITSICGTTLAIILFLQDVVIYANIGDSRAYCFDGRNLIQKSHDHTMVNDLLLKNQITQEEALVHPQKNILTRAITGENSPVDLFFKTEPVNKDYIYLICSDGLYNMVDAEFIRTVLAQSSIFYARDILLTQAYANGATDNITLQIIKPVDDVKTIV